VPLLLLKILLVAYNIGTLILKGCGFKKEGLTKIIDAIGQNVDRTQLKALDLSLNFASGTAAKMHKLMSGLGEVLKRHPTLEYLGLAGNGEKMTIGKEIEPLFKALGSSRITELDISGNKIGDQMAVMLCDQLKTNGALQSVSWDNNMISIAGWRAFLTLITSNRNFTNCPAPILDVDRAIKDAKNKEQFRDKIKEILDAIRDALRSNSGGVVYSSIIKLKQGKTYGENFKQFLTMGVSGTSDPSISQTSYPVSYQNYSDNNSASAYDPVTPVTSSYTNLSPQSSYGTMPINNGYNNDSFYKPVLDPSYLQPSFGTMTRDIVSSYEAPPPPPPPPPGARPKETQMDNGYEEPPPPPPRDDYQGTTYDDYPVEYDDTQYEDEAPPPPPPPF